MKKLFKNKKKGFTLIEIIAVIAIIAILAAVLVPKVLGYMKEARTTAVIDQARKVVTAAESYELKTELDVDGDDLATFIPKVGDLLTTDDVDRIDDTLLVSDCKKVLDQSTYKFSLNAKNVLDTAPTPR